MRGLLALPLAAAILGGCGAPRGAAPPAAAGALLPVPPLAPGLRVTIAPNLPDVTADDLPDATQRTAEVVALDAGRLRIRWTGRIRRETLESAERRASWLRARTAAGSRETPPPPAPPHFEEAEISGTLDFPDFGSGRALVLPALWPEGRALLRGSSCLWLGEGALAEIAATRRATIPFLKARALRDPAAALLDRAGEIACERQPDAAEEWRLLAGPGRSPMTVNGAAGEVATIRLASWFGTFDVLADPKNPLVVAADPSPSSSGVMPLFAPARVLRTLLAYRVTGLDARTAAEAR